MPLQVSCWSLDDGSFCVFVDDGSLSLSDVNEVLEKGFAEHAKKFGGFPSRIKVAVYTVVTSDEAAFLEKLTTLKVLEFPDRTASVPMLPFMKQNDVLVLGIFESAAEEFALKNDLRFRPMDFCFARACDSEVCVSMDASLFFADNGSLNLLIYASEPPGSGGRDCYSRKNISLGKPSEALTVEGIARAIERSGNDRCTKLLTDKVSKSEYLPVFLRCIQTHKMYLGPLGFKGEDWFIFLS